jgi:hypothetical protein
MDPIVTDDDPIGELEQLILLLDRASREIRRVADQAGTGSPLHWLGLGVFLAQAQAVELLPPGHVIADLDQVEDFLDQTLDRTLGRLEPDGEHRGLQLLRVAEQITRSEALPHADWPGLSPLVVELCDLIREASSVGC